MLNSHEYPEGSEQSIQSLLPLFNPFWFNKRLVFGVDHMEGWQFVAVIFFINSVMRQAVVLLDLQLLPALVHQQIYRHYSSLIEEMKEV